MRLLLLLLFASTLGFVACDDGDRNPQARARKVRKLTRQEVRKYKPEWDSLCNLKVEQEAWLLVDSMVAARTEEIKLLIEEQRKKGQIPTN